MIPPRTFTHSARRSGLLPRRVCRFGTGRLDQIPVSCSISWPVRAGGEVHTNRRAVTAVWAVRRFSWIGQASDTVKRSVPFETFSWPASCCETPPGIGFPRGHPDRFQLIRGDRRLLRGDPAFSTATLGSASQEIVAMIHTTVFRLCAGLGREENHAKTRIEGTRHQVRGTPGEGGESAERTRLVQFAPGAHPAAVGGGSRRRLAGPAAGFSRRGSCPGGKAGGISRSPEASR